ncbi:unnamed protein product [Caenorhabditis angaria]|uniref:CRAL-TRIO domain-containing protein n=1 Tax=Caenorhabditis angaria TaxID=860376 RepID=A0A9P1MTK0_9PELO|nr:unnamed protein product [Caenorhabditis angaria]
MNWQKQRQNVLDRLAFVPGGIDREGNVLLVISTSNQQECSYEQLVSLLALLADTLPPNTTQFTVLLDTRHIQLKTLKFYLRATQQALYRKVRQVLIIQPEKFLDQQKINFDLIVSGYTLRTTLISIHKLSKFIDVHQLPEQFGGTFDYEPEKWLETRLEIMRWEDYIGEAAGDRSKHDAEKDQKLEEFVTKLHSTKRIDDEFSAQKLKKSILDVKDREERDNKEELIEEHAAGVNRLLDWVEGSGEKWLSSLCQVPDNFDEADGLVKQHEQLTEKTKEIAEQTQQLAEMATRLMAVCPQYSISLHKMREQVAIVGEHFEHRVAAQTEFAKSNRDFQAKLADFTRETDGMLEKLCGKDDENEEDWKIEEMTRKKKELDEQLNSLNQTFNSAMEAGRQTMQTADQFEDVLPADQFIAQIRSSLNYITQRQNRCNDLANVKRLKQQQLIQLGTIYSDCDQAIKWLSELKETLNTEYNLAEIDEKSVRNLRNDRRNLDQTAKSTYEYGKQLLNMAKSTERTVMLNKKDGNEENGGRKKELERVWKELVEMIGKNEERLRVVESFLVTHREMLDRVTEVDRSLRERIRTNGTGKLNSITMSTERRRLRDNIEELASIGKMLSEEIGNDETIQSTDRETIIHQLSAKLDEVKTAQKKMESLFGSNQDDDSGSSGKESGPPPSSPARKPKTTRPLSKVAEEEAETSPILPRAVRLIESTDGTAPAIRLSKNESYL